jgi:hypothetical protein
LADNLFCDATQEQPSQAGPSMRAHNDKVYIRFGGRAKDFLDGLSLNETPFHGEFHARRLKLVDFCLDRPLKFFGIRGRNYSLAEGNGRDRADVQDNQSRTIIACQRARQPKSVLGPLGEIRRMQNCADNQHSEYP